MRTSHRAKNKTGIVCDTHKELFASNNIQDFMGDADIGLCYIHLVDIAQENQDAMKEKLGLTIYDFGKFAWGNIFGSIIGSVGNYFISKERILERFIGSKKKICNAFLSINNEKKNLKKKSISIKDMQKKNWGDEVSPFLKPQTASLCVAKVITCMRNKKEEIIKQIKTIHNRANKKEWGYKDIIALWGINKIIPLFIDHCIANTQDWQLFFAKLEKKTN